MNKVLNGVKKGTGNIKDSLVLMDKKNLLIIFVVVIVIIVIILVLCLKPSKIKCEQTNDISGVTNKNTVEITYKGDQIREVKTTFDYKVSDKKDETVITQIKESMTNLSKVYKKITGVTFEETKSKNDSYQAVQTVNFKEISNEDLANIGIERSYKKAKSNYESAGFTCK